MPNIFTPNADYENDIFRPILKNCVVEELRIYNRWGQILHLSNLPQAFWDGRTQSNQNAPEATYYYVIVISDKEFSGYLQLIR